MYTPNVSQLLRTFHTFGQSGSIILEPLQGAWRAQLHFHDGEVQTCGVQRGDNSQSLLKGTEALQWLLTQEELVWRVGEYAEERSASFSSIATKQVLEDATNHSDVSLSLSSHSPSAQEDTSSAYSGTRSNQQQPSMSTLVPRKTQEWVRTMAWPREYRYVFALIDGHRTSTHIAALLHLAPERIVQVLHEMKAQKLIEV